MVSVAVVGMGRLGLILSLALNKVGDRVLGVTTDPHLASLLNQGRNPIRGREAGLDRVMKAAFRSGGFRATTRLSDISGAQVIIIAPEGDRPIGAGSTIEETLALIGPHLTGNPLVVTLASSGPGKTIASSIPALEAASGKRVGPDLSLAHLPLRLTPGEIIAGLATGDHLLGAFDQLSLDRSRALFQPLGGRWLPCTILEAEVAAAATRARDLVDQALADELAERCEELGVDLRRIRDLTGLRPAGPIVEPGPLSGRDPGTGGLNTGRLVGAALTVEARVPRRLAALTLSGLQGIPQPLVAVLGVANRPEVEDWEGSPSLVLIEALQDGGAELRVHDPFVSGWPDPRLTTNLEAAVRRCDAVVLATAHGEYRSISLPGLRGKMLGNLLVDGRGIWDPSTAREAGLVYRGIGHGG